MIKDKYILLLITEIQDKLKGVKIFIKLDITNIYNQLYIIKGDKQKIVFRLKYSHFKYLIILFRLINILALF